MKPAAMKSAAKNKAKGGPLLHFTILISNNPDSTATSDILTTSIGNIGQNGGTRR